MLKEHLEAQIAAWQFIGHPAILERFCVKHGTAFVGSKLPRGVKRGAMKECFANSARVVPEYEYWEGFAMSPDLPLAFLHAWNVRGGKVVDRTLREPEKYHYLGMRFPPETLWKYQLKTNVFGLLDIGWIKVPLLREIDNDLVDQCVEVSKRKAA